MCSHIQKIKKIRGRINTYIKTQYVYLSVCVVCIMHTHAYTNTHVCIQSFTQKRIIINTYIYLHIICLHLFVCVSMGIYFIHVRLLFNNLILFLYLAIKTSSMLQSKYIHTCKKNKKIKLQYNSKICIFTVD